LFGVFFFSFFFSKNPLVETSIQFTIKSSQQEIRGWDSAQATEYGRSANQVGKNGHRHPGHTIPRGMGLEAGGTWRGESRIPLWPGFGMS
jgi:hypothetical protein